MKITFEAHHIETAPKDRAIMVLFNGIWAWFKWDRGEWEYGDPDGHQWTDEEFCRDAEYWAEIADMAVPK